MRNFFAIVFICFITIISFGQFPAIDYANVNLEVQIAEHDWQDGNTYQFLEVSIVGLPEMNNHSNDTVVVEERLLIFGGGFNGPMRILNKKETVYSLKLIHESVYDSVTQQQKAKKTGLFLIDDFENNKDSLLIICSATYGHPTQSQAYFDKYINYIDLNPHVFTIDQSKLIANKKWYAKWEAIEENNRVNQRKAYFGGYGDESINYDHYWGRIGTTSGMWIIPTKSTSVNADD